MDINRVRQILSSEDKITVTYNGRSIWINSVNPINGQAFVKTLDGTNEHYKVSINDLTEQ
ncbi:H-type small acid-soluble spore protein [Wukongibacter baidiensis]|uniref:H-type small acid-soluble spore protein n=1 Tax=Wukongibacter baidiensis TaxID=1723361 RepID=UPI003D7F8189